MSTNDTPSPRKRRRWPIVLAVLAAIVGGFVVVIALQPSEYRVVRSTTMAAPAAAAFAQVNSFHNWEVWNPWGKIDPAMRHTHEGAEAGVGAAYSWAGNNEVGEGRMTIIESRPHELVRIRLEFFKPLAGTSTADFTFQPQGQQTQVTWSMAGHNNFIGKAVCLFMDMDQMIGGQFEKGLADMKAIVEGGSHGSEAAADSRGAPR